MGILPLRGVEARDQMPLSEATDVEPGASLVRLRIVLMRWMGEGRHNASTVELERCCSPAPSWSDVCSVRGCPGSIRRTSIWGYPPNSRC